MSGLTDGCSVVLRELDGDYRVVELGDTAMPQQGVDVTGELRMTTTWYPGQSMASVQVMGTQENEITFEGWFKDSWLSLDGGAAAAFQDLRNLWLGQRYCELSWGSLLVRRGFLRQVKGVFVREADIRYTVVFAVVESDEATVIARAAQPAAYPSAFGLSDALDLLSDAADAALLAATLSNALKAVVS